jgi:hypothetical protein
MHHAPLIHLAPPGALVPVTRLMRAALALLLAGGALGQPAHAATTQAVALTADGRLAMLDLGTAMAPTAPMAVSGVDGRIVGIDVRPADGRLYGVSTTSILYTIDPQTGVATEHARLQEPVVGERSIVLDFNPAADRLRLMVVTGANYRIHPDTGAVMTDGKLVYAGSDPATGKDPQILAGAYSQNFAGTTATALYTIDVAQRQLNLQTPPNDGVQTTIGRLGFALDGPPALDIVTRDGVDTAWLVTGDRLVELDLASGAGSERGRLRALPGEVIDIAVLITPPL